MPPHILARDLFTEQVSPQHTTVFLGMKHESVNDNKSGELEEFQYKQLGI